MALIITLLVPSPIRVLRVFASLVIRTLFIRTFYSHSFFIRTLCEHREKPFI
jgi:hypothetical protein